MVEDSREEDNKEDCSREEDNREAKSMAGDSRQEYYRVLQTTI